MAQMRFSLPDHLDSFVDQQTAEKGYASRDDYLIELIQREEQRQQLRSKILEGMASPFSGDANEDYFKRLLDRAQNGASE